MMQFNQFPGQGQSNSRSLLIVIIIIVNLVETVKNMFEMFRRNSTAGVGDLDLNFPVRNPPGPFWERGSARVVLP